MNYNDSNGRHLHETVHTVRRVNRAALQSEDPRSRDFHAQSAC